VYLCRDGRFCAITASDDAMWSRLAAVAGIDGGRWPSVEQRRDARAEIDDQLGRWCATGDADAVMEELQAAGVAAGAVQDAEDLAERDPQLAARGYWLTADHDVFGPRRHDRFPGLWDGSDLSPYRRAPSYLGEANFEVLADLVGLDAETIAEGIAGGLFS
jgi:crotonobetainyl-CoA:carnitine CoA-transferase CaiB-like acyl-CoA transferase